MADLRVRLARPKSILPNAGRFSIFVHFWCPVIWSGSARLCALCVRAERLSCEWCLFYFRLTIFLAIFCLPAKKQAAARLARIGIWLFLLFCSLPVSGVCVRSVPEPLPFPLIKRWLARRSLSLSTLSARVPSCLLFTCNIVY